MDTLSASRSQPAVQHCLLSAFTSLRVVDRHSDASSTGMEVVWLSDRSVDDENAFVLVLQEGTPRSIPNANPQSPLGPISHFGFALPSLEAVDAIANEAKQTGLLQFGPTFLNPTLVICASFATRMATMLNSLTANLWENPVVKSSRVHPDE